MYREFHTHSIRSRKQFNDAIVKLFQVISSTQEAVNQLFVQIFARNLFEYLMLKHEAVEQDGNRKLMKNLSKEEQNAVRYTAGYVTTRLPRKTHKLGNLKQVFDNMTTDYDKDTRLNFSKEWVTAQTRGGLTLINDVTHLLFCQLEKLIRVNLPDNTDTLRECDFRELVAKPALQDQQLSRYWD